MNLDTEYLLCLDERSVENLKASLHKGQYIIRPFRTYLVNLITNLEHGNEDLITELKRPVDENKGLTPEINTRLLSIVEKWENILVSRGKDPFDQYTLLNRNWNPDFVKLISQLPYTLSNPSPFCSMPHYVSGFADKDQFLKDINATEIPFLYYVETERFDEQASC